MTSNEIKELRGLAASMGPYDDKNPCKRAVILGRAIEALEQEPKIGHWMATSYWYSNHCSNCNYNSEEKTNYCPNCGAKMESEVEKCH